MSFPPIYDINNNITSIKNVPKTEEQQQQQQQQNQHELKNESSGPTNGDDHVDNDPNPWIQDIPWIRQRDSAEEDDPPQQELEIRVAVSTVPRKGDQDYLLQTLQSMSDQGFPSENILVYFHTAIMGDGSEMNQKERRRHRRWTEAARKFSNVSFYRNDAPPPPGHPALYSSSRSVLEEYLPKSMIDSGILEAHRDSLSRKEWRRKLCWDVVRMMQHQLYLVAPQAMTMMIRMQEQPSSNSSSSVDFFDHWWERNDTLWKDEKFLESQMLPEEKTKLASTVFILNEDDAKWVVPYSKLEDLLESPPLQEFYDFYGGGALAWGFRGDALLFFVQTYAPQWCDFKPVDWVLPDYFKLHSIGAINKEFIRESKSHIFVEHIGEVSSTVGRLVEDIGNNRNAHMATHTRRKTTTKTGVPTPQSHMISNRNQLKESNQNGLQETPMATPTGMKTSKNDFPSQQSLRSKLSHLRNQLKKSNQNGLQETPMATPSQMKASKNDFPTQQSLRSKISNHQNQLKESNQNRLQETPMVTPTQMKDKIE